MAEEKNKENETMDSYLRDPWACYEDPDSDCAEFIEDPADECGCCCCYE